ncbi:alpha-L-fucosidase [Ideonella sp.]|uniref:alpha-L-fucosidase n=1 Tax=Ideonella sp. TaxID=1929293 RepID=UPI002B45FF92|nr:alpha-L-fucosidase [Ideonella sp.]HJV68763.1 alpha-L-fucosidase [Ideonella sp.]
MSAARGWWSAASVIHRLADIVSKNGNLLLSIPVRGNGAIDADERKFLDEMAAWTGRNGEAIHGTRPWHRFGEGPTRVSGGMFNEGQAQSFTAEDIRFTTKDGALYAIALGWPSGGDLRCGTARPASVASTPATPRRGATWRRPGSGDPKTFGPSSN